MARSTGGATLLFVRSPSLTNFSNRHGNGAEEPPRTDRVFGSTEDKELRHQNHNHDLLPDQVPMMLRPLAAEALSTPWRSPGYADDVLPASRNTSSAE
jgi:hypothetical protein